jgi:hypothetical protein
MWRVPLRIDRELNVRFAGMLTPFYEEATTQLDSPFSALI